MNKKSKTLKSKKIIVVVSTLIMLMLGLLFLSYFFIHSYIKKMNLVTTQTNITTSVLSAAEIEFEIDDIKVPESPKAEIATVENEIQENMEENQTSIMYDKDVFHILLIGSDTRKSGDTGRSDAMILMSINKKAKTITATSFLRDIYLQIPGKTNNRINIAYSYGGADLLMNTIEKNFKILLNKYISVDFYAFIDIVDAIGGVTLEVTEEEIPVINDYIGEINLLTGQEDAKDRLTGEGIQLLNGKQALGYSRNRYVGNSDFERTARQRRVLEQIYNGVKDSNLIELNKLLNIILPQVTTNLTEGEIFSLILSLPSYKDYELKQWRIPVNGSYTNMRIGGMEVLGIDFEENIKEIKSRIYEEKTENK